MLSSKKLSSIRKSKGMSQETLAENSRISLRTIQRIESGTTAPRPYTIKTLAETLGVTIEELTTSESNQTELVPDDLAKLRLINFSALTGLLIPLSNIFFTVLFWRKYRAIVSLNNGGKKIISFQLLWTLGTLLLVFLIPLIQYSIVHSYVIGRFPPTVILVYILMLLVNLIFTIRTALQLQKGKLDIYPSIPILF